MSWVCLTIAPISVNPARWLARHRLLRVVAVLLGIYNFANQMGQAILVLLATQTLHVSTRGYGLLLAAWLVVGARTLSGAASGRLFAPGPAISRALST